MGVHVFNIDCTTYGDHFYPRLLIVGIFAVSTHNARTGKRRLGSWSKRFEKNVRKSIVSGRFLRAHLQYQQSGLHLRLSFPFFSFFSLFNLATETTILPSIPQFLTRKLPIQTSQKSKGKTRLRTHPSIRYVAAWKKETCHG